MGEIKSTLDLVMERTRHLSLSAEEKALQQRDEFNKRLAGLLQQYGDNALTVDELQQRVASLQAEMEMSEPQAITATVLNRVDPDEDNRHWLALLQKTAPATQETLQKQLEGYSHRKAELMQSVEQRLLEQLFNEDGISGPAVAPNPQKDARFRQDLDALRSNIRKMITTADQI
jgi:uncharacterized small protein (DUF1192 family)